MLPFSLKIEIDFWNNGYWKRGNVNIHYRNAHSAMQNLCFYISKTMVSPFKTYVFTLQNLCFCNPKPMLLSANIWLLRSRKTCFRYNCLLVNMLQKVLQNARISRPFACRWAASPVWESKIRIFYDNFWRTQNQLYLHTHRSLYMRKHRTLCMRKHRLLRWFHGIWWLPRNRRGTSESTKKPTRCFFLPRTTLRWAEWKRPAEVCFSVLPGSRDVTGWTAWRDVAPRRSGDPTAGRCTSRAGRRYRPCAGFPPEPPVREW